MVDTNSDPRPIDFVIPSNDDASKSIDIIMTQVTNAVAEGLAERKSEKQTDSDDSDNANDEAPKRRMRTRVEGTTDDETEVSAKAPKAKTAPAPAQKAESAEEEKPDTPKTKETETPKAAKEASEDSEEQADDLTKIEGMGPKAAEALVNSGMDTFAKLAEAEPDVIREILTEANSRMSHLDPATWPKQAKMAADGKWDELNEWQEKAKAGVE
jgi:small subunit ribosomal protein S2